MTTNIDRGSAKIYQFPARGRFAAGGDRDDVKPLANFVAPRGVKLVSGSAWYHDDAIKDADRFRKT